MQHAKAFVVFLALITCGIGNAADLRIMNFNTMCSICDLKKESGPFKERIKDMADTIKRHDPDLISLQELQFKSHVKKLSTLLNNTYEALYKKNSFYPATDATLFVRKDRFEILATEGVWLGPKLPQFSFGWRFAIPRRFHWAHLRDKQTGQEFIFAGSHFDNHFKNKDQSAAFAQEFFAAQSLPVLFAADTNLRPEHLGYAALVGETMTNTFDISETFEMFTDRPTPIQDACNAGDYDKPWPACRIDHVLISNRSPWKVKSWGSDLFHYYKDRKFVSDHRAVIVDLTSP